MALQEKNNLIYKTLNEYNREKFGCKVYKLSLNAGFSCPNRDGSISREGCIFCTAEGGGEFAERVDANNILFQLEKAKKRVEVKNKGGKYIAYFQAFTNTYAPYETLKELYYKAISPDYIVGLSIATRPDCLPKETIELLSDINKIKPVTIELGLQTSNENTAEYINRGYCNFVYSNAVKNLKAKGIEVVTHIILGLPSETEEDMLNSVDFAVLNRTDGIKFHLLHIMDNTKLAEEYFKGRVKTLSLEEYARILKNCILRLPKTTVVHRITGDGDKNGLIAPMWTGDKKKVLNHLNKYLSDDKAL